MLCRRRCGSVGQRSAHSLGVGLAYRFHFDVLGASAVITVGPNKLRALWGWLIEEALQYLVWGFCEALGGKILGKLWAFLFGDEEPEEEEEEDENGEEDEE